VFGVGGNDSEAVAQGDGSDDDIFNTNRLPYGIKMCNSLMMFVSSKNKAFS
jgi:hypothetical protein